MGNFTLGGAFREDRFYFIGARRCYLRERLRFLPRIYVSIWPQTSRSQSIPLSLCTVRRFSATLRKAPISYVVSVCLSVRSHWKDFDSILYWGIFRKYVKKTEIPLKSDKNNRHFKWRPIYIFSVGRTYNLWTLNLVVHIMTTEL
jgi:hypothetical protein